MESTVPPTNQPRESLRSQIRSAVIWRSGSQIAAQLIQWLATFLVIRILNPADYGLYSMTQVILVLLTMLNGYGLASGLVQRKDIAPREVAQLFGMLLLLNLGLAAIQIVAAPLAAAYYRQPLVTDMLRIQALLYIATPFIAVPYALLARELDFRKQAKVNFVSSIASAATALGGALAGWGVWTLVAAPIAFYVTRAIGMSIAARWLIWPSFDFRGAGALMRYGALMTLGSFFWFIESQADIFIAGRHFSAHELGLYSTALFLTQIFVAKFVPPLNEVAFSAYARIQHDKVAVASGFARAAGAIMLAAMPFYLGLAVTAEPLVLSVLGPKWAAAIPIVHLLAFAMPFMTVQVLFSPACEAVGRPGIGVENGATGGVILTIAFLIGVRWGPTGLAWSWISAYPLYLAISCWRSLPVLGVSVRALADAIAPAVLAAVAMAVVVALVDAALPPMHPVPRLAIDVITGATVYAGWLLAFARGRIGDLIAIIRRRPLEPLQAD
ncbi:lipopolysaccharide biosynthesis protein [Sphingomonas koreensis]|nr:lipopolysaccharide biosynthesis protein [Sphingomonas koreensis]